MSKRLLRIVMIGLLFFSAAFFLDADFVHAAQNEKAVNEFVTVPGGHSLYVNYTPPKNGKPTMVVLHGLTYSLWQWEGFAKYLTDQGYGVLLYDMYGMGATLLKYAPILQPINHFEQVQDLSGLLGELGIEPPYNLVGLSYGAGIATAFAESFPSQVGQLFLMAPYTEPLRDQDQWIRGQIAAARKLNPFNPYSDDQLYDYFLRNVIYASYPSAEPVVLENPFKLEAIFRMVQGIRKYRGLDSANAFPPRSVHLMIPSEDQYIKREIYDEFWLSLPERVRASYLYMKGVEHKVPQASPEFSAGWVVKVMEGADEFYSGRLFDGFPLRGRAVSGEFEVTLPKGIRNVPF